MKNYRYVERRNRMIRNIGLWVGEVILMILLAYLLVHYCVQIIAVHGESMQPSYYDNDLILVSKLDYHLRNPNRGDAAVIELENGTSTHYSVKRVIGLPGETVQINEGKVYINGKLQEGFFDEDILSAGLAAYKITLEENEYFVMGDNCNNSEDSRVANIGNINREKFVGCVKATLRSSH